MKKMLHDRLKIGEIRTAFADKQNKNSGTKIKPISKRARAIWEFAMENIFQWKKHFVI